VIARIFCLLLLSLAVLPAAEPAADDGREQLRKLEAPWYDAQRDGWRRIEIPARTAKPEPDMKTSIDGGSIDTGGFVQVLAWVILTLVVLLLAWMAFQSFRSLGPGGDLEVRAGGPAPRPADLSSLPFTVPEASDPEAALEAAITAGDWSLAVVWVYAALLIRLDAAGMVRLGKGATNRGCLRQAEDAARAGRPQVAATTLADAVRVFERTYFGHRGATRSEAERLAAAYATVKTALVAEAGR
jgi:hypothetical protein